MMTKKKLSLDYLREHPDVLETVHDERKGISEILAEIKQRTGAEYGEIGELLGIRDNHVGKLIRGDETTVSDKTLLLFSHNMKIPFSTLVYRNTMERLRKVGDNSISQMLINVEQDPNQLELFILEQLTIPMLAAYNAAHDMERRAMISQFSQKVRPQMVLPVPDSGDSIYVRQNGSQMLNIYRSGTVINTQMQVVVDRQIPPGAVVEVKLVHSINEIRNGDIVYIQIDNLPATNYLYYRKEVKEGVYEIYAPINAQSRHEQATTHVIHSVKGDDKELNQRRIIYGKALRIVHYDLTL